MALTFTVTILPDHKGFARPKAVGDEYVVDALINVTEYATGGLQVTAASLGLNTITQVICAGDEELGQIPFVQITANGNYCDYAAGPPVVHQDTKFTIKYSTGSAELSSTSDEGTIRVRVYGTI